MTIVITASPETESRFLAEANRRGITLHALLEIMVIDNLPTVDPKFKTPQERIAAMDAIAAKNADLPVLPDSAFDRENIYEDRL